jgi:hypothetical protein
MWSWITGEDQPPAAVPPPGIIPELPTPKSENEFRDLVQQKGSLLLSLVGDPKWTPIDYLDEYGNISDIRLFEIQYENNPIAVVKAVATLKAPAETIFKLVQSSKIDIVKQFDKDLMEIRPIKDIGDSVEVVQTIYSAPFPVSNRDFIVVRGSRKESDGTFLSINTSVNVPGVQEIPDFVRGACLVAGWIIRPDGEQCHCMRVAQVDPRGWIPPFVVNLFKTKVAEGINDIRNLIATNTLKT